MKTYSPAERKALDDFKKGLVDKIDFNIRAGGTGYSLRTVAFTNEEEKKLYDDAWQRYLDTKEQMEIESKLGNIVSNKLQCLGRVVRSKDKWSDLLDETQPNKRMKKLTKLQKIKDIAFQQGKEYMLNECKEWKADRDRYYQMYKDMKSEKELYESRVNSLKAVLQSIHTIAQGTSRL